MPKKSYMNKKNILTEGFFDSIIKTIRRGKTGFLVGKLNSLERKQKKSHSKLKKMVVQINKDYKELMSIMSSDYGIEKPTEDWVTVDFFLKGQEKAQEEE